MTVPAYPNRRSIRLQGWNYAQAGYYFVTICTLEKYHAFGRVENGKMLLNQYGKIAHQQWLYTQSIRPNIEVGQFVVMPNHIHGILIINMPVGATGSVARKNMDPKKRASQRLAPTMGLISMQPNSLGSIIGQYKSVVTKKIRSAGLYNFQWQRNYYEQIIRNEKSFFAIIQYIQNNPQNWHKDELYACHYQAI